MKSTVSLFLFSLLLFSFAQAQSKKELDQQSIMAMSGCFEVTFNFAETFQYSSDPNYTPSPNKISKGLEWVEVLENSDNSIVLQHILIVGSPEKPSIVKHWRQDWLYENTKLYAYNQDMIWNYENLNEGAVVGQWTQKVYQVDDSPRYEGSGTWIHVDGKSYWESVADAPLPRREHTIRNDYDVTIRENRHEITATGWVHEQDNQKVIRAAGAQDVILAEEKGFNSYEKVETTRCQPAQNWWVENHEKWDAVRAAWLVVFERDQSIAMAKTIDDMRLMQHMFLLEDDARKDDVLKIIDKYITEGSKKETLENKQIGIK